MKEKNRESRNRPTIFKQLMFENVLKAIQYET